MDLERAKFVDHSMPRIVPTVEARDVIHVLREVIHDLAFALISPLRTDHCCDAHFSSICSDDFPGTAPRAGVRRTLWVSRPLVVYSFSDSSRYYESLHL